MADVFGKASLDMGTEPEVIDAEAMEIYLPEFPASIAVLGAPGANKAATIKEFTKLATPWFTENDSKLVSIINPALKIEKLDQAMGPYGDYREHLWAYFRRFEDEFVARGKGHSTISSGTILDNMAHAGVNYETIMLGLQHGGLVTPDTQQRMQKLQIIMTTLTFLFLDNFRYKFAFFIPLKPEIILPGKEPTDEERYARRVEAALLEIFRNFTMRIQILDQPTPKEKASVALEVIQRIMTEGVEIPTATAPPAEPTMEEKIEAVDQKIAELEAVAVAQAAVLDSDSEV